MSHTGEENIETKELSFNVNLTPAAIGALKQALAKEAQGKNVWLRLAVEGGGCSGLAYKMDFVEEVGKMDREFEFEGIKVLVDARSLLYLAGMTVDYSPKMVGGGFKFINPKAKRSCGCGTSFSV